MLRNTFLSLLVLLFSLPAPAQEIALKATPLTAPAYHFDPAKLANASDAFHFLRTFVDYYYLLLAANSSRLPTYAALSSQPGWCVGDAHPENFGALLQQDGKPLFTMNDMDDSGPCPLGLDFLRLLVSATVYDQSTDSSSLVKSYLDGLAGRDCKLGAGAQSLLAKSEKDGAVPDPSSVDGQRLVRLPGMEEVTDAERASLLQAIFPIQGKVLSVQAHLLDAVSTAKEGGGSGGLLRYELLLDNGGNLLHLELKREVEPSLYPVATAPIPAFVDRMLETLKVEQSAHPSSYYSFITLNGFTMLVRPRYYGNRGVKLDKDSAEENRELIRNEACVLGGIHAKSLGDSSSWAGSLSAIPSAALAKDVESLAEHFKQEFRSLRPELDSAASN